MKHKTISVILPSYNERDNLLLLIPKILRVFSAFSQRRGEIIVVDDNSPDGTAQTVKLAFGSRVRVITRYKTRGLGTAIAEGIRSSKGDVIIGMDADGNHATKEIPRMTREIERADVVVASRFIGKGGMNPRWRWWGSFLMNSFFHIFLDFPIWDNTSGFYAIRREALMKLPLTSIYQGYGDYHLRLMFASDRAGLRINEIPTRYEPRQYGESKSRLLAMAVSYCSVAFKLRFQGKRVGVV